MSSPENNKICALIPAAGRGTRLKADCPKLLVGLDEQNTIWSILKSIILPSVEQIHIVLSDFAQPLMEEVLEQDPDKEKISTSIQLQPLGMGDAIFGAHQYWRDFDTILIAWGDQVNLSADTVRQVAAATGRQNRLVLPLSAQAAPYVQYDFSGPTLINVRQSREGDLTDAGGFSDIGLFALSVPGLYQRWQDYLAVSGNGLATGEINFLPFMPYLSRHCAWEVLKIEIADPDEARGVNTPEDLDFARRRFLVKKDV